jgi:D-serine deaminase-like pyridoxal phosphate-dependent protein
LISTASRKEHRLTIAVSGRRRCRGKGGEAQTSMGKVGGAEAVMISSSAVIKEDMEKEGRVSSSAAALGEAILCVCSVYVFMYEK